MRARDNPFATVRLERLTFRFPAGDDWNAFFLRLEAVNYRGAIIGPEGSGKTTLLEQLAPRLRERGFEVAFLRLGHSASLSEHVEFRTFDAAAGPQAAAAPQSDLSSSLSSSSFVLEGSPPTRTRTKDEHEEGTARHAKLAGLQRRLLLLDGAERLGFWGWQRLRFIARRHAGLIVTAHRRTRLPTLWECRTTPTLLDDLVRELLGRRLGMNDGTPADLWRKHRGNLRLALLDLYDRSAVAG